MLIKSVLREELENSLQMQKNYEVFIRTAWENS